MSRVALPLAVLVLALGFAPPALGQGRAVGQVTTPTASPGPLTPLASPTLSPNVRATATAAAATITAVDAAATAAVGAPLTAIAATATALAVPTSTPTALPTVPATPTALPTVPATPTVLPTPSPLPTATPEVATPTVVATEVPAPTPTVNPLATSRTVLTTAPIAVGGDTIAPGAPLEIPLDVALRDGAIPPGTVVRLPGGQVVALPADVSIPAVENPTIVGAPLNVLLPRPGLVGDTQYPSGTVIVLPSGTGVLGALEPNATILLRAGTAVQVGGRTHTLVEPLQVVVSAAPVARPVTLPATGDAAPVLWPAGLALLLLLAGWWLRRGA